MLSIKTISAEQAHEIIQGGGLNWILFPGDSFDAPLFEEWLGRAPTRAERDEVDRALAGLTEGEALQIT